MHSNSEGIVLLCLIVVLKVVSLDNPEVSKTLTTKSFKMIQCERAKSFKPMDYMLTPITQENGFFELFLPNPIS